MTQQAEIHPELVKACASFEYFLRHHVFITDVRDRVTRVIQWQWWPCHEEMVRDFQREPRLIELKPRQMGFSWGLAALHVWDGMFTKDYLGGVISAGQVETNEFLKKCRFIIEHLPAEVYPDLTLATDNTEQITFRATGGTIMAFPSTPKAGIGFTFARLVIDEAAFHPFAEENFNNYAAAAEQGQTIILSSMGSEEKQVTSDWFQRMWLGAPDNGFLARFYPWNVRPGRDEAWYEAQKRLYAGKPGAVERLYPSTPEDAFRSMLLLRFDAQAVREGRDGARPPLKGVELPAEYHGLNTPHLRLWSLPRPGVAYVAYTDPAEGKGLDYTATGIMEARTRRHIATLRENVLEPTQHGALVVQLCRWFEVKLWGIERARGEAIFVVAGSDPWVEERLYWHRDRETRQQQRDHRHAPDRLGFPMTEQTRRALIDDLGQAIADRSFWSDDDEFWREAGLFLMKNGRPEAGRGAHDDLIIVMGGLIRMSGQPEVQVQPAGRTWTPDYHEANTLAGPRRTAYEYSEHR